MWTPRRKSGSAGRSLPITGGRSYISSAEVQDGRVPILYLASRVDLGRIDRTTIGWFESIDRDRWAPSLLTTDVGPNRGLFMVEPFAEEVWDLPDQMTGVDIPEFILGHIENRGIRLLHIMDSRLGFDLLPDIASLARPPAVVAELNPGEKGEVDFARYAARRYGNLIDAFAVTEWRLKKAVSGHEIPRSKISIVDPDGGRDHAELYERLLASRATPGRRPDRPPAAAEDDHRGVGLPPPLRLARRPCPAPTVSVGIPCFKHGIFLERCIHSVKNQILKPERIVVVDDCSDDPETIRALRRCERDPKVTVLRQPGNLGPSAARNRALEQFDTNYGLWIDADDELLPGALDSMVAKLEESPEWVGFAYPHVTHTGNRTDDIPMPAYNLWLLMQHNLCPSPCMFDLRVFREAEVSYPEDMVLGHEDWDLMLQLAERGIYGVPADSPTFLYRKQGFSRVSAVDQAGQDFRAEIEARHRALYLDADGIKAAWAPALSIVLAGGGDWKALDRFVLEPQTCRDFEVLGSEPLADGVRTVAADDRSPVEWLQEALREARGRWVCVLSPAAAPFLERRSFVEQLLRGFEARVDLATIALCDVPGLERQAFARIGEEERRTGGLSGIAFERTPGAWLPRIGLAEGDSVLDGLAVGLQARGAVQWRLAPAPARPAGEIAVGADRRRSHLDLNRRPAEDAAELAAGRLISQLEPRLPGRAPGSSRRWEDSSNWTPVDTQPLCRHCQVNGSARLITNDRNPPSGFRLEFELGLTREFALPGAQRLVCRAGTFELSENQNALPEGRSLGYVETEPLPACESLELCEFPQSGERVLVAGDADPLRGSVEVIAQLGWIEPHALPPGGEALRSEPWRAATLRRAVDIEAGRHRYGVDSSDGGQGGVPLGSVLTTGGRDLVALRLRRDGRLVTELAIPGRATRDPRKVAQWVARPPGAGDSAPYWSSQARARHLVRHWLRRRLSDDEGETLGWLIREARHGSRPLYSTTHLVTGDQLVTSNPSEAVGLGYSPDGLLGFILELAATSDSNGEPRSVPWASA